MYKNEKNQKIIEGLELLKQEREEGNRLSQEVFDWYCQTVITTPVEIIPVTKSGKVLMFKRDATDTFFPNLWHTPGSIQLPRETIKKTIDRILNVELEDFEKIGELKFVGVLENNKGNEEYECIRQQERSVVFVQEVKEQQIENTDKVNYFEFANIPVDSIPFHRKKLITKVEKFLQDGKIEITYAF